MKFTVSAGLLYFAFSRISFSIVGERFAQLQVGWLALAAAIALFQVGLGGIRWLRIVLACGVPLSVPQALRVNMIATFFNQVLPSTVGGDAARILMLARAGAGWRKATNSVLIDRFIGVLVLALLVAGGQYWSFTLIPDPLPRLVLLLVGLGSIAGAVFFLLLGSWHWLQRWQVTRYLADLSILARKILFSRAVSPEILLLSLLIHFMTVATAWSLAHAVAARLGFLDAFLLVLPVVLIATIPVSIGGWGVREAALVLAFSYAGLPQGDGLVISVLLGVVMFAVGIVGGAVWLISPKAARLRSTR